LGPWLALRCAGDRMITALKQLYEQNHTGDLRALKKAYEQHAEDCAQAAELMVNAGRREVYLGWHGSGPRRRLRCK
jgi:hypothetical protein